MYCGFLKKDGESSDSQPDIFMYNLTFKYTFLLLVNATVLKH